MLSNDTIEAAMRLFDVREWWLEGTTIGVMPGGTARKAAVVCDGHLALLKEAPWYADNPDGVEIIAAFVDALRESGHSVPAYYRSVRGGRAVRLSQPDGLSVFTLQGFVEGRLCEDCIVDLNRAGEGLGRLHLAAAIDKRITPYRDLLTVEWLPETVQSAIKIAGAELPAQGGLVSLLGHLKDQASMLEHRAREDGYYDRLGFVHGDCNPTNILVGQSGEIAAFVDFDNSCLDNPLHDLARLVVHTALFETSRRTFRFAHAPVEMNIERARAVIGGYLRTNPGQSAAGPLLPIAGALVAIELASLGLMNNSFGAETWPMLSCVADCAEDGIRRALGEGAPQAAQ